MAYAYKNLVNYSNVTSGISEYVLAAPVSWFAADGIKTPVAPFTNQGDSIKIVTAHVFETDKAFFKMQLAPGKNKLDMKTAGDIGLSKMTTEVEVFIPGSYVEVHEQVRNLVNTPLIVLVKDCDCVNETFYQLGCDCMYAWMTAEFSTGTTKDGVKGYTAKITFDGPLFVYDVTGGPEVLA